MTVISGHIETGQKDSTELLAPGDIHCFAADTPHVYRTTSFSATILVTIKYGNKDSLNEHQ